MATYTKIGRIRPDYSDIWDSKRSYTALEIVKSANGYHAYIAKQDVPAGTALTNANYWGEVLDISDLIAESEAAVENIKDAIETASEKANAVKTSAVGNPAAFYPDEASLLKPIITLEPIQPGNGDPSLENIRPISGRTAVSLTRCGKNLLPNTATTYTTNGITYTVNTDGTITANGTAAARAQLAINRACVLPAGTYCMSQGFTANTNKTGVMFARYQSSNGEWIYIDLSARSEMQFTLSESASLEVIVEARAAGIVFSNFTFYPMIRLASDTDATYEAYQGDDFSVDFGQTVYGGALDWNTGVFTADWRCITFDGTETSYFVTANTNTVSFSIASDIVLANQNPEAISSHLMRQYSTNDIPHFYVSTRYWNMYLPKSALSSYDAAGVRAFLAEQSAAGTPFQIAYKLEAPVTIQLATEQMLGLAGINTVYSDGDGMTVNYNKSLLKVIEELTNAIISLGGNV